MPTATRCHPAPQRAFALVLACACALLLAGCHETPPPPSNVTPEKAVATNLRLTATGDFDGLMQNRLPPADYKQWRTDWDIAHAHPRPISEAQQQQFAKIMQMLTAPGAETRLAKRLAPELAKLKGGKQNPLPIASGILEAAGQQMIAESPQLGPSQRGMARQGLDALIAWAKATDFSNPKKAQKAIDLICATARQLHVQTLEQWRALDYAATMQAYSTIWNGLEGLLNLYGVDLAKSLTEAKVDTVTQTGTQATVKLDVDFTGQTLTAAWPMVELAGHWYDAALLDAWRKAHPAPATTLVAPVSATSVAPASTAAPAPAASGGTPSAQG